MLFIKRVSKYVIPQWPRILLVVLSAFMVGVLISISFMTVIPLLKVMMGEEGLHGWIDRQSCNWRYGMDFYIPDTADILTDTDTAYELKLVYVDKDTIASDCGLMENDRIIRIGENAGQTDEKIISTKLLETLAKQTGTGSIAVEVLRYTDQKLETVVLQLKKPERFMYEQAGFMKKWTWGIRWEVMNAAQKVSASLPRDNNRLAKKKAVRFIIIAILFITIFRCTASFTQKYTAAKVVQSATAQLREEMFDHAMQMPVSYFTIHGTSDATSRMLGDVGGVGKGISILLGKSLQEPIKAILMLSCAMILNYQLTLIFLAMAPPTILFMGIFGKQIKKFTKKSLRSSAVMLGKLQESMAALRVIKVYNRHIYESGVYKMISRKLLRQSLKQARADAITGPVMDVLATIAGCAALLVGITWVTNAHMESSVFFGILLSLGVSAEAIRKSSDIWNNIQNSNAAIERVFYLLNQPVETNKPDAVELGDIKSGLEFRNIVFTYPNTDKQVLNNVNLTVKAGSNIAIVGPNGSGKTTLINLLPRFFNPDSGQILIDGLDIQNCTLQSLRDKLAMVTQNVVTFHDSIAANISYGKPEATMDEIINAAKQSYAHEFIEPLPNGYQTVLGEHSTGLSGGQMQRIVIARAILKNPSILIFDEAMSQVDADSESKIHNALETLMHNRTSFVIAHRFSTVVTADTIVVMDDGRIVASGSHQELMDNCDVYRRLYETQLMQP